VQRSHQEARNRGNGISEIEGKGARVAPSDSGEERVSIEEAEFTEIEEKVAMVAARNFQQKTSLIHRSKTFGDTKYIG